MSYENRPIAIVLIGLPGSGKSTFIKTQLAIKFPDRFFKIISSDDILDEVAVREGITYSEAFKDHIGYATHEMKRRFREVLESKSDFVWDQTNMSRKKRRGILSQLPSEYYKVAVDFSVHPVTLQERLEHRGKTTGKWIPKHVIESMGSSYQAPSKDEGFDEIVNVRYDRE